MYQLGRDGQPEWTVVAADQQTAGKGRFQRQWDSPANQGLWFSVLLRPQISLNHLNLVNLFAAYSLADYLERHVKTVIENPIQINLKWPNDLWVDGKKICGILLESSFSDRQLSYLVVGIGLNVNQNRSGFAPEIREIATSLKMITEAHWNREQLLAGFLNHYYEQYTYFFPDNFQSLIDLYLSKSLFKGEKITIHTGDEKLSGIFTGLTEEGYLILSRNGEEKIITAGDVFGK
ncbi:MAG: biotin--[acetyl-CoA-carboxylase] ligase [Calditrichae bacterium]|nr:biotin--[acetyl-CoA-carboxylase] ligase [Calditrichia bacterium]NIW80662.1 biotin--[acetyl-CoA-carboxylase] ligase [Calditrichia bacterium]